MRWRLIKYLEYPYAIPIKITCIRFYNANKSLKSNYAWAIIVFHILQTPISIVPNYFRHTPRGMASPYLPSNIKLVGGGLFYILSICWDDLLENRKIKQCASNPYDAILSETRCESHQLAQLHRLHQILLFSKWNRSTLHFYDWGSPTYWVG